MLFALPFNDALNWEEEEAAEAPPGPWELEATSFSELAVLMTIDRSI